MFNKCRGRLDLWKLTGLVVIGRQHAERRRDEITAATAEEMQSDPRSRLCRRAELEVARVCFFDNVYWTDALCLARSAFACSQ